MASNVAAAATSNVVPSGRPDTSGPTLDTYKRLFTESRDMTQTARLSASKYRRYYDGKLDEALARELRRDKKPDFVINRVRPGVEGMIGVIDKGKSDPRCYPRNPQDENAAEVATDTLRYACDSSRWHQRKLDCARNMFIEGVAAVLIEVDERLDIQPRRIRYEEFFYDPYSRELDFTDASYMGVAKWMYADALASRYPDQAEAIRDLAGTGDIGDSTWSDRPNDNGTTWSDPRRRRLLTVEMYHLYSGQWTKCVFVGSLLLEQGPSPYLDNNNQPCCPIEAVGAYVDDENRRYGVVADMCGPQDEINVYRRKAAHLAMFRQFQESSSEAAFADKEEVRREGAKADGVIPAGYTAVPNTDKFSMDNELLREAKAEIERIGPNPAILARDGANSSGRNSLIRQQAGLTELAHLFAGLEDFELRCFHQMWARARQFWTEPKYLRVTDDEQAFKFVHINEPVVQQVPTLDPTTLRLVMQSQIVGVRNPIAQMDVDITVDTTPDTANIQQEQFTELLRLAQVYGPQEVPFDDLVQMSDLPKKREFLDRRKARQANQPPNPMQQQAAQLELAGKAADVENTQADTRKKQADALKAMSDAANQSQPDYFRS